MAKPGLLWNVVRVCAVAAVWTLLFEAGLHLAGVRVEGSLYAHDDLRRFRLRPHATAWQTDEGETFVTINSRGFRDRERQPGSHPGIFRVAVIGDSAVAGIQVEQPETFTQVAENTLAKLTTKPAEVLNFGVPNYNLAQQYLTLRDEVLAYRPDLVIEAVSLTNAILNSNKNTCVNASPYPYFLERQGTLQLYDPALPQSMNPGGEAVVLNLENRLDLVLYGLKAWRTASLTGAGLVGKIVHEEPPPEHFYERSLYPPKDAEVAKAWSISEQTLLLMRDLCTKNGVEFWVATMDVSGQVHPNLAMREKYRLQLGTPDLYYADNRLANFAGQAGIRVIQCAPVMAAYAEHTGKYLHGFFNTAPNYGHLNVEGHRVVGELFSRKICERLK